MFGEGFGLEGAEGEEGVRTVEEEERGACGEWWWREDESGCSHGFCDFSKVLDEEMKIEDNSARCVSNYRGISLSGFECDS